MATAPPRMLSSVDDDEFQPRRQATQHDVRCRAVLSTVRQLKSQYPQGVPDKQYYSVFGPLLTQAATIDDECKADAENLIRGWGTEAFGSNLNAIPEPPSGVIPPSAVTTPKKRAVRAYGLGVCTATILKVRKNGQEESRFIHQIKGESLRDYIRNLRRDGYEIVGAVVQPGCLATASSSEVVGILNSEGVSYDLRERMTEPRNSIVYNPVTKKITTISGTQKPRVSPFDQLLPTFQNANVPQLPPNGR